MKENKKKPASRGKAVTVSGLPDDLRRQLRPYRGRIDALDDKIVALLGKRFGIVRAVGELKAKHNFPSYISDRVVEVRERNATTGRKYGIDPDFMRMLYSLIIYQSCAEEDIIKHKHRNRAAAPAKRRRKV